jgi:hypothetical protein
MGRLGVMGAGALLSANVLGQTATFTALRGHNPPFAVVGSTWRSEFFPVLSGEGATVTDGRWRWTRISGVAPVGFVPGSGQSSAVIRKPTDLSFDGKVEVGRLVNTVDGTPIAVYWESAARFDRLPIDPSVTMWESQCLSDDGNWFAYADPGNVSPRKTYRRSRTGIVESFPNGLGGTWSPVWSPSANGDAMLGDEGVLRIASGSTASTATLVPRPADIYTYALSSDGSRTFGPLRPFNAGGAIWNIDTGSVDRFWPPIGFYGVQDTDLSDDGSLVLGTAVATGAVQRAFVRRTGEQARELRLVLDRFGDDSSKYYVLERAGGLSRDGQTLLVLYSSPLWYGDGAAIVTLPHWEPCPADLNFDGVVDDADFSIFARAYDRLTTTDGDLTIDQVTDDADFSIFAVAYDALLCP